VRTVLESVYVVAHFLQPTLVQACQKVFEKLGTPPVPIAALSAALDNLTPGTKINKGEVLYQKMQTAEALERLEKEAAAKKAAQEAARKKAEQAARKQAGGEEPSDLSKLDIRVGRVVGIEKHPEADALYVEQIDLGEGKPRTVVSGLVKHIPAEQIDKQLVVCLANIKPSKMRGVESQAMLLCANGPDGSPVELVQPPADCTPGMRISFKGHADEPEKQLNPKKKVWEKIQPELNTSAECVACFQGLPFETPHGPCRVASIASGAIK